MLNMLDDKKKKEGISLIVGMPKEKSSGAGGLSDQLFTAMQSGDKETFARVLDMVIEQKIMDMEMSEED